jgi:hypothetical protein
MGAGRDINTGEMDEGRQTRKRKAEENLKKYVCGEKAVALLSLNKN